MRFIDHRSLIACAIYYALWVWTLPYLGHYRLRQERLVLEGGEVTHKLVKVALDELSAWDREHDAQGRRIGFDNAPQSIHGSPRETASDEKLK